jgi:hypothetical protein
MLRSQKQSTTSAENVTVAFVIRADHSDRLAQMAKADDRSVSSVIRLILDDYFARVDAETSKPAPAPTGKAAKVATPA